MSEYIWRVRELNILQVEIGRVNTCLVDAENDRKKDHVYQVKQLTQIFRALLTEKARQEAVNEMSNHNGGNPENTGPRPADNASTGVRVRNILKQKVTRG